MAKQKKNKIHLNNNAKVYVDRDTNRFTIVLKGRQSRSTRTIVEDNKRTKKRRYACRKSKGGRK